MRRAPDNPAPVVDRLLEDPRLWRGRSAGCGTGGLPTGYAELDRHLPGGGWPRHALTEVLTARYGIGELRLLMPALARLSTDEGGAGTAGPGWIAWIAPPFQPYPPALEQWGLDLSRVLMVRPENNAEMLWSAEQALVSGTCAAVLLWPGRLDDRAGRRLQLAAEKGGSWAVAFRPLDVRAEPSAAALRIALEANGTRTRLDILKSRGGRPAVLHDVF